MWKNNQPAHLAKSSRMTGAILPPTDMSFIYIHILHRKKFTSCIRQTIRILWSVWKWRINQRTLMETVSNGGFVTAENRWCPVFELMFGVELKKCLILYSSFCNTSFLYTNALIFWGYVFTNKIYALEMYVPFHVKRPLNLSDSNKSYLFDVFT